MLKGGEGGIFRSAELSNFSSTKGMARYGDLLNAGLRSVYLACAPVSSKCCEHSFCLANGKTLGINEYFMAASFGSFLGSYRKSTRSILLSWLDLFFFSEEFAS